MFYRKGIVKNLAKFKGKQMCRGLQKETAVEMFSCELSNIFKRFYFEEHVWATASEFVSNGLIPLRINHCKKHPSSSLFLKLILKVQVKFKYRKIKRTFQRKVISII